MLWIYAMLPLLLSQAWGRETGTNHSTNANSTTSSATYVVRNQTFHLGHDVRLKCNNETWDEVLYIIWILDLGHKSCRIGFTLSGQSSDECQDGKTLRNTSSAQSYLHIPKFSENDVGVYKCEAAYKGGTAHNQYNVGIRGPPPSNAWLDYQNGTLVAVCNVSSVKTAANISWNHEGATRNTQAELDGIFIVESRLELRKETDAENLKCTIRHPDWPEEWIIKPTFRKKFAGENLRTVVVCVAGIVIFLAGTTCFVLRKQLLSCYPRTGRQSISSPSHTVPKEEAEEVEPYASYVQRVNSIYNSSADLFA